MQAHALVLSKAPGKDGRRVTDEVWRRAQHEVKNAFLALLDIGVQHCDVARRNVMLEVLPHNSPIWT